MAIRPAPLPEQNPRTNEGAEGPMDRPRPGANQTGAGSPTTQLGAEETPSMTDTPVAGGGRVAHPASTGPDPAARESYVVQLKVAADALVAAIRAGATDGAEMISHLLAT